MSAAEPPQGANCSPSGGSAAATAASVGVHFEVRDHVARVTIDRPAVMNAVDHPTEVELESIWTAIEADRSVRVVVLTGAGERAFCAGADMNNSGPPARLAYWSAPRAGGFGGIALRETL